MASNTEFKTKLIKLSLPRLIVDVFGMGVDVDMLKSYGNYMSDLDELDNMLRTDGENHTSDEELKTMVRRIINSCTKVLEVLEEAKKEVTDIKQAYTSALESHACADI